MGAALVAAPIKCACCVPLPTATATLLTTGVEEAPISPFAHCAHWCAIRPLPQDVAAAPVQPALLSIQRLYNAREGCMARASRCLFLFVTAIRVYVRIRWSSALHNT